MHRAIETRTVGHPGLGLTALAILVAAAGFVVRAPAAPGVAAALLNVVQNDTSNNTVSVTVTATLTVGDLSIRPGSNRGDYNLTAGVGFSDDVDTGVVMTCVAENGRDNGEVSYPGVNYCTTALDYSRSGGNAGAYFIPVFQAPAGAEFNVNVAAAFFSYSNWLAGYVRNSGDTNGGLNNLFTGSPGLALGTHFVSLGAGTSVVSLVSLGVDSRTDGVLLVTGGRNEDNYALSQVNSNNGTWTVFIKDNGTDAVDGYEHDPVAFVYVPRTNTSVVSGRFRANGTRLIYSGPSPAYDVTTTGTGTWRLTIPGHSPNSGVLIVSAEGGFSQNQDNIVSYQPDGDGWILQSRDLTGNGLQTPGAGGEPVASFVFIPASAAVAGVNPPHNAVGESNAPVLQVSVSNAAPGNLTVQFFGRVAAVNPATDFSIVALPDTQFYTGVLNGGTPNMFIAQTEWIITNRVARNIAYVAHLGDITQNGDLRSGGVDNISEWLNATNAMYRLENTSRTLLPYGIPYGMAVGNHDQEPIGDSTGTTIYYNQFFGVPHFSGRSYYAGHYGANNNNHFDFFSAGGMDFIVIYLEYDATLNPVWLNWANDVLRTNQNRRAIMVTHNFGNTATPVSFSAQGAAIYDAVKTNANVFLMLGGHVTGEGSRADTYNGNTIRTFVSDYQGWTNGGSGFMRIIDFSPSRNEVVFTTYSPYFDTYATGPTSEISFTYDMSNPVGSNGAPYAMIGTVSNIPSGSLASLVWSNRAANTAYEWYVVVTDELGNATTSAAWRFTTAPNVGPTVANATLVIYGDAPTNLNLTASDPNGDPLTFLTNTMPTRGLLASFTPAGGAFTYAPIRGFRGFDFFNFSASDGQFTSSVARLNLNVVAPPDGNANGLPDAWETRFGLADPNADDDGDGQTNAQEYYANTNPTNAASVLRITSATRAANGHVTLAWPTVGGTRYRVQYSDGGPGGSFTGVFTDVARPWTLELEAAPYGSAATQTFVDDFTLTGGAPPNGDRFYRLKVVQ